MRPILAALVFFCEMRYQLNSRGVLKFGFATSCHTVWDLGVNTIIQKDSFIAIHILIGPSLQQICGKMIFFFKKFIDLSQFRSLGISISLTAILLMLAVHPRRVFCS